MSNMASVLKLARKKIVELEQRRESANTDITYLFVETMEDVQEATTGPHTAMLPRVFERLAYAPASTRYLVAHGGRGSGKSHFFATELVKRHVLRPGTRSIGLRQVQRSIQQSVKALIELKIYELGVQHLFTIQDTRIKCPGGGIIVFQGLQSHTSESVKSLEGFDIFWVEEAQTISAKSWRLLRPTMRKQGGQIWASYNPVYPDDPIDDYFRGSFPPSSMVIVEANWNNNPLLNAASIEEKNEDYRRDPGLAEHVWGGGYLSRSDASVFTRWRTEDFEDPAWYERAKYRSVVLGADHGYIDPAVIIMMHIDEDRRTIYISHEGYKTRLEIDKLDGFFRSSIPPEFHKRRILADSARPDLISYLRRQGWNIRAAKKGPGSIDEGIKFLQSFDIVIHPRCLYAQREFARYSYKVDPKTEEVLDVYEDKNNHVIDSCRYAASTFKRPSVVPL